MRVIEFHKGTGEDQRICAYPIKSMVAVVMSKVPLTPEKTEELVKCPDASAVGAFLASADSVSFVNNDRHDSVFVRNWDLIRIRG